ncbi:fumarylacetoacetate hydrolase family protein [Geminicoccaceae bacterium 1502E]|nr:fumarylacetoacetate hydrolase family protein [Geminicoccaceae bacterium 1502E]
MLAQDARKIADLLLEARWRRMPLAPAEDLPAPASAADAYTIQRLVSGELGPVAAWKVGAASPEAEPGMAPIHLVHASPASLPAAGYHRLGVEVEIAYRIGRDLPARDEPWTREEVAAAIDAVMPAIEVVDTRLAAPLDGEPFWKLADFQLNGGLVVGAPRADWRAVDPLTQPVRLVIDGVTVAEGRGGNPAGDLMRLVTWLAGSAGRVFGGLRRGQIVTTGSLTGLRWVEPGARIGALLDGLGEVSVEFPG